MRDPDRPARGASDGRAHPTDRTTGFVETLAAPLLNAAFPDIALMWVGASTIDLLDTGVVDANGSHRTS